MSNKTFWKSKTFWMNVAAIVAWVVTDKQASPETMASINNYFVNGLAALNLILRLFSTKTNLTLKD